MHSQQDRALRLLWGVETATNRGPKARWTPEDIAAAAVVLADEGGLDAVSLARVAARLDMTTTAIYRYADSKATLVELMVDVAVGEPPRDLGPDWRRACRDWAHRLAERYAAHPWLSDVRPAGMPRQPHVYGWIDALVREIPDDVAVDALRLALLLDGIVRAHAGVERGLRETEPVPWLSEAVAARYPALAAAPAQDVSDPRSELEFALDAVLRGVSTVSD
ncbi:TetR/AcrR family transcriptional regulator [Luteimicrobium sp. NPDC057192]|uniref:TetR/AcrR family transcriptional regulator n=1 Tax=Luteimicrobium sp. NPDC057192 TaxID=3346042 RepID=UPI0036314C5C